MEEIEDIRPPDQIVRERLFQNDYIQPRFKSEEDDNDEMKRVLEESEQDFEFEFAILESRRMEKERQERSTHFAGFLIKIKQFAKIDKTNASFYSELIEYIESYERGEVQCVTVNYDFYMIFIRVLDNMRIHSEEKSRLFQFIQLL